MKIDPHEVAAVRRDLESVVVAVDALGLQHVVTLLMEAHRALEVKPVERRKAVTK